MSKPQHRICDPRQSYTSSYVWLSLIMWISWPRGSLFNLITLYVLSMRLSFSWVYDTLILSSSIWEALFNRCNTILCELLSVYIDTKILHISRYIDLNILYSSKFANRLFHSPRILWRGHPGALGKTWVGHSELGTNDFFMSFNS